MVMKIGVILPNNIWFCPYMSIYTHILDENKIDYDIISWNKDGRDPHIGYQYSDKSVLLNKGILSKIIAYAKYVRFVKNVVNENQYDKLIVFGPQISIFLSSFLAKRYKGKYILDYRDLSIEQKPILKQLFNKVLANSFFNAISSPGFKKCLSNKYHYVISHNFDISLVNKALGSNKEIPFNSSPINVLTIGGIRNYDSNVKVIESLANQENICVNFVGKGIAAEPLENYSKKRKFFNVYFKGFYEKHQEASFIIECSFINIFYPRIISHDTIMSNRFYNALIYKKPMIVTSNSTQGDYVEKYNLGLSVENCENLAEKLKAFIENQDAAEFNKRCNSLLREFVKDYELFKAKVLSFVKN